jgi:hypothetical protein
MVSAPGVDLLSRDKILDLSSAQGASAPKRILLFRIFFLIDEGICTHFAQLPYKGKKLVAMRASLLIPHRLAAETSGYGSHSAFNPHKEAGGSNIRLFDYPKALAGFSSGVAGGNWIDRASAAGGGSAPRKISHSRMDRVHQLDDA